MIDLHVHTQHSCDSNVSIDEYCKKALQIDLKCICFTDHIDFNKADDGYGYYDANKFFNEFNTAKEKYSDTLMILSGIEFGEPHIYRKEFDEFRKLPYDFILGTIHFWIDNLFPSKMIKNNFPIDVAFDRYWEEVYKIVEYGGFDSFAHIDFPKRYYKECIWSKLQIRNIFKVMVKNNIALEINTSSLRKGLTESMPDKEFLEIYEDVGGVTITIGADTHTVEELAADYEYAKSIITPKLKSVIFIKRIAEFEDELFNN